MEPDIDHMRATIWLMIASLFAIVVFAAFPFIDLRVSALFFLGEAGAWFGNGPAFAFWRDVFRRSGETLAVIAFIVFVGNLILATQQKTGWRVWLFLWGSTSACAGVLVNGILKSALGRARPNGVLEFGGIQTFTPPFQLSDQCSANCSFSSGEVALISSLAFPLCVLIWPLLSRNGKILCGTLAALAIAMTAMMRIATGRHFLSDTMMSMLFASMITLVLYRLLAIGRHRQLFTVGLISHDVANILAHASRYGLKTLHVLLGHTKWAALRLRMLTLRDFTRRSGERRARATAD